MGEGKKFDAGKPRLGKLPGRAMNYLCTSKRIGEGIPDYASSLFCAAAESSPQVRLVFLRRAWELLSQRWVEPWDCVAKVMAYGAEKYAWDNWKLLDNAVERYMDAALRHALSVGDDPESGLFHDWHTLTNIAFLTHFTLLEQDAKLLEGCQALREGA